MPLRALHTEVILGFDDAFAEVTLPNPIDQDPRGERMIRLGEPARERQAATGFFCIGPRRLHVEWRLAIGKR